ncbi:MAG: four-helix bundle copper-binding protein [Pirellulales bacterium]
MQIVRAQLESLETACRSCADECDKHASMHDHCRICAEACRECAQTCRNLVETAQPELGEHVR